MTILLAARIEDKDPAGPRMVQLRSIRLNPPLEPQVLDRPEKATAPPEE